MKIAGDGILQVQSTQVRRQRKNKRDGLGVRALAETAASVLSTYRMSHGHLFIIIVPRELRPSSDLCGHQKYIRCTYMHASKIK